MLIWIEDNYPKDIEELAAHIGTLDLPYLTQTCIAAQLSISPSKFPPLTGAVLVFNSAVATFCAPSDPSGTHSMRCEHIRSTPDWRKCGPRRDCAFVVEDESKSGMRGMAVVHVMLFFSIDYNGMRYPCALVDWFKRVGQDPLTGLWVVSPDIVCSKREHTVIHLDSLFRGAHLIPVFGTQKLPHNFHFSYSLDAFRFYFVNKYIDHHVYEVVT